MNVERTLPTPEARELLDLVAEFARAELPPRAAAAERDGAFPRDVFEANTTFPDSRSRWEQGLRMTQFALTSPLIDPGQANAGFIRPPAALAVIVVTNEDDSSFGTTDYYARVFRSLKGKGNENLVSFSIIGGVPSSVSA